VQLFNKITQTETMSFFMRLFWTGGKSEAEKVRLMGEAQGVDYREQVNAFGVNGVALVETLKVIGEKGVRITPDIMASGGNGDGGIGSLLLLNLFRDQMNKNGDSKPEKTKE
jgi:hypothetical protein